MSSKGKTLSPRPPGWKFDLPTHNDTVELSSSSKLLRPPPNYCDDIYLELPRSSARIRGFSAIFACLAFLMATAGQLYAMYFALFKYDYVSLDIIFITLAIMTFLQWITIPAIRMDHGLPRDEPIRFNRLRRKVYVYQYKLDRLRVFSRRYWGVQPEVYDWDDLHAEACSIYLPMGGGGLIENIIISVRKPGTKEVTDRFFFSYDWEQGQAYWAIAQAFMEVGPQALPDFVYPPRDWNNESIAFDFIPHFAPKVQWPEELDLESRTAPNSVETS